MATLQPEKLLFVSGVEVADYRSTVHRNGSCLAVLEHRSTESKTRNDVPPRFASI